jgi:CubicO group peptidase (beta-lactamase class C family)
MKHPNKEIPPSIASVTADPCFATLRAEIIKRVREEEFPSVSIGAIKNDQILWCESIGWADKEKRLASTPDTAYGIASLGKSITATAVMVLVEQGKVKLDGPISEYLGKVSLTVFEGKVDQVTVRRILNMTAAIPHGHMVFNREEDRLSYSTNSLVQNRGIVVFPPGEVYLYSNFAYAILEKLIENVSGKSFPKFLKTEVYDPLEMKSSFIGSGRRVDMVEPVTLYNEKCTRLAAHHMLPRNSLAMYASVNDLV